MRFLRFFNPYLIILIFLELILFATNYQAGTYLIGWDNVMPELNFGLNFKRSLFSLWQEYRGLGLMDGMAHGANLLHTVYLYLLSLAFPEESLRYIFTHLTHLVGGVGFFFFARFLTKKSCASFLGALFYMLNIGIMQMYFAPLEVFAMHFAALPWLALTITNSLQKPTTRNLLLLFITSILTTPQGFVPTVFIAFGILVFFLFLFQFLKKKQLKPLLITGLILFLANAFWLLPYAASALTTPKIIQSTRINQYASEEIYYRNQAHGDLIDVLGLRGFMLSTIEYDHRQESDVFFMEKWREHQASPFYIGFYILCLVIIFLGIGATIKEKNRTYFPYVATLLIAFVFLANNTPVLEQLNTLIRTVLPLIGEAFRFPFTKFITIFIFCLAIFFTLGLGILASLLNQQLRIRNYELGIRRFIHYSLFIILTSSLLFLALPAFEGNFTSPLLRLTVPQDYFSLIDHLNKAPKDRRIAVLPAHTFWNWHYRTWGHRGSGFLWYGIEQPMLERAFDPWSLQNEQYYNELSNALHNQDSQLLKNVITKYNIGYLLLDQYVVNTLSTQPINYDSLTRFLNEQEYLKEEATFGRIKLYRAEGSSGFVTSFPLTNIDNIQQGMFMRNDIAFATRGTYMTDPTTPIARYYPFSALLTEKLQSDNSFAIAEDQASITLSAKITKPLQLPDNSVLTLPSLFSTEYLIPVAITVKEKTLVVTPQYPTVIINGQEIRPTVTPITVAFSGETPQEITFNEISHTLKITEKSQSYLLANYPNTLTLKGATTSTEITFDTATLSSDPFQIMLPTEEITSLQVKVTKIPSPLSVTNILTTQDYTIQKNIEQLHPFLKEEGLANARKSANGLELSAQSSSVQLVFYRDNLFHQASYILLADTEYKTGLPVNFYIDNPFEKRAEMEAVLAKDTNLNALIIPPTQNFFQGYGFHFTVKSVGTEMAVSKLKSIGLYPFPKKMLEQIIIEPKSTNTSTASANMPLKPLAYSHTNPVLYTITTEDLTEKDILILSQAFDSGWKAYTISGNPDSILKKAFPFFFGTELTEHVKINNWANGWSLDATTLAQSEAIMIVYLPQYLQYVGFALPILILIIFLAIKATTSLRRKT